MSEKVEYTACILVNDAKVNGESKFSSDATGAGKRAYRITRDERFVAVEELSAPYRVYEIPRELCVLERRKAEGPSVAKAASK